MAVAVPVQHSLCAGCHPKYFRPRVPTLSGPQMVLGHGLLGTGVCRVGSGQWCSRVNHLFLCLALTPEPISLASLVHDKTVFQKSVPDAKQAGPSLAQT